MKKFLSVLAILCFAFILTACGEPNEFWKQTLTQFELILGTDETPKNQDIFYGQPIVYISNVQTAINSSSTEFSSLKSYDEMLKLSFGITKTYYKNFGIVSLNATNEEVIEAHNKLNQEIENLNEEITNFRTAKQDFENAVKDVENLTSSPNALQELKEYKRAFSSLILNVNELNINFLNTYELSYNQITTSESSDIKYCYNSALARIIYAYNLYAFGEFDGEYTENAEVKGYITDLNSKLSDTTIFTNANFNSWKDIYDRFLSEIDLYKTSLDSIDLTDVNEDDLEEVAYKNKVEKFLNDYVEVLYSSTLTLLGE